MPAGSVLPHDLAGPGDFEPFRDCFASFVAGYRLRHKGRKIAAVLPRDNRFCAALCGVVAAVAGRGSGREQSSRFQLLT